MAIKGVENRYTYQSGTGSRTKTAPEKDFYGEFTAAAKQAEEKDGSVSGRQCETGKSSMGVAGSYKQRIKPAVNTKEAEAGDEGKNITLSTEEIMQMLRERMNEIYEKVKKGETEQRFQIGASSFTLKEWDKFIEKFDESEEDIAELIIEARETQRKAANAREARESGDNEEVKQAASVCG